MRSTAPCAPPSTRPPPNTRPPRPPLWKPSQPRPEPCGARSSDPGPVRTVPEPVLLETNRTETRQEEPHEHLVPMDLPRAKPRLGHRALRVPVTVPAARRSLRTRDVRQLVDEQCFLPSPSGRVGVEIEWLAVCLADPAEPVRPEVVGEAGAELPAGSRLTFEPGGQVELSSPPLRGIGPACASIAADAAALTTAIADHGVGLIGLGLDPGPARARCVDSPRYEAMEAYFDAQCAAGRTMMRSTAALQVNVDLGPTPADAARRWRRAHAIGPLLAA